MAEFYRKRKKICMLCAGKKIKYNEPETLKKYGYTSVQDVIERRQK